MEITYLSISSSQFIHSKGWAGQSTQKEDTPHLPWEFWSGTELWRCIRIMIQFMKFSSDLLFMIQRVLCLSETHQNIWCCKDWRISYTKRFYFLIGTDISGKWTTEKKVVVDGLYKKSAQIVFYFKWWRKP